MQKAYLLEIEKGPGVQFIPCLYDRECNINIKLSIL